VAAQSANDPDTAAASAKLARRAPGIRTGPATARLRRAESPVTRRIDFASLAREMVRYAGKIPWEPHAGRSTCRPGSRRWMPTRTSSATVREPRGERTGGHARAELE
jgi:hypothetical protein